MSAKNIINKAEIIFKVTVQFLIFYYTFAVLVVKVLVLTLAHPYSYLNNRITIQGKFMI